jgi:hypothetical protein
MSSTMRDLRRRAGALLLDLPSAFSALRRPEGWVEIVNRIDEVSRSVDPVGIRCHSQNTSSMHVCDMFPSMGRRVLNGVLKSWEFELAKTVAFSQNPTFSFVIPHRGVEREPLLIATIRSIASLPGDVECIVVEQDETPKLSNLPETVRHLHLPHPEENERWHKCFAFNHGVQAARGEIIICHDGDIIVPTRYLEIIRLHLLERQQEVVFPQRFLFYLPQDATDQILRSGELALKGVVPEIVKQNWTGGTLAITKDAYERVGGFDESFTGWTGEDREFYDRCETLDGWFFGYVPFIHLWHAPQAGRASAAMRQQAMEYTRDRLAVDRAERVSQLNHARAESK